MILPTDSKERKAIPVYTGFIKYFPRAIAASSKDILYRWTTTWTNT